MKLLAAIGCWAIGSAVGIALLLAVMSYAGKFSHQCIVLRNTGELMCTQVFR